MFRCRKCCKNCFIKGQQRNTLWLCENVWFVGIKKGRSAIQHLQMTLPYFNLVKTAPFLLCLLLVFELSHELDLYLLSIIRPLCVLQETDSSKSTNKICRQLIYHLTPHSKWTRQSVPRRKSQAWWVCPLRCCLTDTVPSLWRWTAAPTANTSSP